MSRSTLPAKLGSALLGVLLALVLLEAGLRAYGGVFQWQQQQRNQRALDGTDTTRVLCIGESTTAMGGNSAYPAQLEQILNLREGDRDFRVLNRGIPGTDTSVLLDELEGNLDEFDPHVVVAMMGANDYGDARPFADGPAVERAGFPRSLKAYRLAAMLARQLDGSRGEVSVDYGEPDPVTLLKRNRAEYEEEHLRHGGDPRTEEVEAMVEAAQALLKQGSRDEAEVSLREAVAADLRREPPDGSLASLSIRIARHEELVKLYVKSLEEGGGGEAVSASALYEQLEDADLVEAWYLAAILAQPGNDFLIGRYARYLRRTGDLAGANARLEEARSLREARYRPMTRDNYRRLRQTCRERGLLLVCVQYPTRALAPLQALFDDPQGVVFVDNEASFIAALQTMEYDELFTDDYFGDFGHASHRGNRLLAENVAAAIIEAL